MDRRVSVFLAGAGTVVALVLCVGLVSATMIAANSTQQPPASNIRLLGLWPTTPEAITALAFAPPQYPVATPAVAETTAPEPETTGSAARAEEARFAERFARRKRQRERLRDEPSVHEQYQYYYGGRRERKSGGFVEYLYGD